MTNVSIGDLNFLSDFYICNKNKLFPHLIAWFMKLLSNLISVNKIAYTGPKKIHL